MKPLLRILHIEDSDDDAFFVLHEIKKIYSEVIYHRVETAEDMIASLAEKNWNIVLSDYSLPHFNGLDALKIFKEYEIDIPFIIISGMIGEEVAVEAMKAGAHDYLMKNNLKRLLPAIERELRESEIRKEIKLFEQKQKLADQERLNNLYFFESMDRINKVIQQSVDLDHMMNLTMELTLSIFNSDRAFLLYPCDPEADHWHVPMECTKPEYPGVLNLNINVPTSSDVAETFKILLNSDGVEKFGPGTQNPLPADAAERFGFKCFMAMAIYPKTGKPWQFGIHQCSHVREWKPDEERLFVDIGRRLADSLTVLLTYQELKESEYKYRSLAENLPDNIIRYNKNLHPIYMNSKLQQTIDASFDDVKNLRPAMRVKDGSYDVYEQSLAKVIETGAAVEFEFLVPDLLPKEEIHLVKMVAERNEVGEITGALAIGRDITERKKYHQEIERLSFSLNKANDSIFIIKHGEGVVSYVNDSACLKLGYSREELLQMTVSDIDPVLTPEQLTELRNKMYLGQSTLFISKHKTKDGRIFPVEINNSLCVFDNINYTLSVVRDISERQQAEEQLRESKERYHMVFEHSPVSIWEEDFSAIKNKFSQLRGKGIHNIDNYFDQNPQYLEECTKSVKILDINLAALHLHNAQNKPELIEGLTRTFTSESFTTFRQELTDIWHGKTRMKYETIVQTLDGERRNVIVHFSLIPPAKDGQTKAIISLIDITEQKQIEQEIAQSAFRKTILNSIANVFLTSAEERMFDDVLLIILNTIKSDYGLFGYIDEHLNLVIPSLTRHIWDKCMVENKSYIFPTSMLRKNILEKVIKEKKSCISEGPFNIPTGHVQINNFLGVPIIYGDKTIGLLSVANKELCYDNHDKEILEEIAKFISPILHVRLQRDIQETIRKHAEQELRLSEERFSTAFKMNPLAISIIRLSNNHFVDFNDIFERNTGYNRDEIINHTPSELGLYENPIEREKMMEILFQTGSLENYEFKSRRKNGEIRLQLNTTTIINFSGEKHFLSIFQDITEKRQMEKKILYATIEAEEKERQRFAQELHDGIGPLLSTVKLYIQWILKPESKANAETTLNKILTHIETAYRTIREISLNLSPHILKNFGLQDALLIYAEAIKESAAINIHIHSGMYVKREIQTETILYRILLECLTNTIKHAGASEINICFEEQEKNLIIHYSDNGKGFNFDYSKLTGMGLTNIQNRLQSINGSLHINTASGMGTKLVINIKEENQTITNDKNNIG